MSKIITGIIVMTDPVQKFVYETDYEFVEYYQMQLNEVNPCATKQDFLDNFVPWMHKRFIAQDWHQIDENLQVALSTVMSKIFYVDRVNIDMPHSDFVASIFMFHLDKQQVQEHTTVLTPTAWEKLKIQWGL